MADSALSDLVTAACGSDPAAAQDAVTQLLARAGELSARDVARLCGAEWRAESAVSEAHSWEDAEGWWHVSSALAQLRVSVAHPGAADHD